MRLQQLLARLRARKAGGRPAIRRRRYAVRGKKAHLKGFSVTQSASIMRAIGRKEETKYIATQLAINNALDPGIHTPNTDVLTLVPRITKGNDENQRVGRNVTPVKCYVDVVATFNQLPVGESVAVANAREIFVVMYIVSPKRYKNWAEWSSAPGPQTLYLLDDGAGNSVPFGFQDGAGGYTTNTTFLSYPVDQSEYTLIKKKIVKLVRNDGFMNTGLGGQTTPNLPQSVWSGRFYYKLPKLIYDDSAAVTGGYPTNSNVMIMFGYCNADNGNTTQPASGYNALSISARAHCWYKDA